VGRGARYNRAKDEPWDDGYHTDYGYNTDLCLVEDEWDGNWGKGNFLPWTMPCIQPIHDTRET
jgi:hypothetical protein